MIGCEASCACFDASRSCVPNRGAARTRRFGLHGGGGVSPEAARRRSHRRSVGAGRRAAAGVTPTGAQGHGSASRVAGWCRQDGRSSTPPSIRPSSNRTVRSQCPAARGHGGAPAHWSKAVPPSTLPWMAANPVQQQGADVILCRTSARESCCLVITFMAYPGRRVIRPGHYAGASETLSAQPSFYAYVEAITVQRAYASRRC
jgi:hypothetical protein